MDIEREIDREIRLDNEKSDVSFDDLSEFVSGCRTHSEVFVIGVVIRPG